MDKISELDKLTTKIDESLVNDYKILDGDHDTLYIKSKKTNKEYQIKITEIT